MSKYKKEKCAKWKMDYKKSFFVAVLIYVMMT